MNRQNIKTVLTPFIGLLQVTLFIFTLAAGFTVIGGKSAYAQGFCLGSCGGCCNCASIRNLIDQKITAHQGWMQNSFFDQNMLVAMKAMTDEIVTAIAWQTANYGRFIDGQNLSNGQLALQETRANAVNAFTPSEAVCKFGTLSRSLGASQLKARVVEVSMSERSIGRQLQSKNQSLNDRDSRIGQFQSTYCDPSDNANGMGNLCPSGGGTDKRFNRDINYTRTLDMPYTLDVDLTDGATTPDEQDVMALASNLYSNEVFDTISGDAMKQSDNKYPYLDMRSVVAKRNVAQSSFHALVGMKAAGTPAGRQYLEKVLQNLGMSAADINKYLGTDQGGNPINPSYYAQMDILTKKIYQDPAFYAHLMDSPANVKRQYAAMQSFGLMQQRDIFESLLRSEMILSLIVELEVNKYQDSVQNKSANLKSSTAANGG